ncbi:MAG: hypothetical protein WCE79_04480 [Xanthobacteraceae bacterium]
MKMMNRRAFVGASLAAFETLRHPFLASAATQCVTGGLPAFLPNRLTVDCASRQNFRTFRQNSTYLGLTGVVSMTFVRGRYGSYSAGNLFLFPWLKDKGRALGANRPWGCVLPTSATASMQASPIPGATLPVDEYFCRIVLQSPWTSFIGVMVDEPYSKTDARLDWFSNIDKLADGKGVGIDWTSHNLNNPWFGGSRYIPDTGDCSGAAWRQLIADGLMQASVPTC